MATTLKEEFAKEYSAVSGYSADSIHLLTYSYGKHKGKDSRKRFDVRAFFTGIPEIERYAIIQNYNGMTNDIVKRYKANRKVGKTLFLGYDNRDIDERVAEEMKKKESINTLLRMVASDFAEGLELYPDYLAIHGSASLASPNPFMFIQKENGVVFLSDMDVLAGYEDVPKYLIDSAHASAYRTGRRKKLKIEPLVLRTGGDMFRDMQKYTQVLYDDRIQ